MTQQQQPELQPPGSGTSGTPVSRKKGRGEKIAPVLDDPMNRASSEDPRKPRQSARMIPRTAPRQPGDDPSNRIQLGSSGGKEVIVQRRQHPEEVPGKGETQQVKAQERARGPRNACTASSRTDVAPPIILQGSKMTCPDRPGDDPERQGLDHQQPCW
uniref:Uncharacterized protein n=1 Tax=Lygus hesperus TaxID=30085 RepID=A0A0K8S6K2_LYGHE